MPLAYDLAACLRFFSRLPLPRLPGEPDPHRVPDFRSVPRMLPLAGLILAVPGLLVLLGAWRLGLGSFLAAALAVAAGVLVTGALHEDGLADVADGFGGGRTPERCLAIMKDSRIGAYGAVALFLVLALRTGVIAALLDRTGAGAAAAMALAAAMSRGAALIPLALLPPARIDGASAAVGRPAPRSLVVAAGSVLALALASLAALPGLGLMASLVLAPGAALAVTMLARRKIGGHTGDVVGACQQVAEIACLLALLACVPP